MMWMDDFISIVIMKSNVFCPRASDVTAWEALTKMGDVRTSPREFLMF